MKGRSALGSNDHPFNTNVSTNIPNQSNVDVIYNVNYFFFYGILLITVISIILMFALYFVVLIY